MATHRINLSATESVSNARVGNANSTTYSWDVATRQLSVSWKRGKPQKIEVPPGIAMAQVCCSGGQPEVRLMQPPKDPIAKVAWEFGFYRAKRVNTREEAERAVHDNVTYYYDRGYGGSVHRPIVLRGEEFLFVYGVHMEGQVWTPHKWWASKDANMSDVQFAFWSSGNDCWPEPIQKWLDAVNADGKPQPEGGGKWAGSPELRLVFATLGKLGVRQKRAYPYHKFLEEVSPELRKKFLDFIIDQELVDLGTCHNGSEGDTRKPLGLFRKSDGKGFVIYNRKWVGSGAKKEIAMETGSLNLSSIPADYDRVAAAEKAIRRRILRGFRKGYAEISGWDWYQGKVPSKESCWEAMKSSFSGHSGPPGYVCKAFGFTYLDSLGQRVFRRLMAEQR